ncbi:MAG: Papain family cysteine protease [Methanobacterium sp. PtaU1.Bin242]|nr:MAG: Papain family cysteine protease [Methanobacterium sp. PtaU1.Bin242]
MYKMYKKVVIPETEEIVGTGWLPPMPDLKDYNTVESPEITKMADELGITSDAPLPNKTDLRSWCSDIENQGNLGSCTAHAAVGVVEYLERRAFGKHIDGSRLFVYKFTRNLLGVTGDTGAWLRNTMGALVLGGIPPEKYWPYTDKLGAEPNGFDREPPAWIHAVADNYEALNYFSHDPQGMNRPPTEVLNSVKTYLAAGIPSMFGFFGFPSFNSTNVKGGIPFPCPDEKAQWGHAIVAVGYDDNLKIKNIQCNKETTGALLIRNSWGTGWGDKGYGWLPYEYVINKLAIDFWSLLNMEMIKTEQFGL